MKKIVIISSSIRNKSNSELLAQQALQGALESGNHAELITLKDKDKTLLEKSKMGYFARAVLPAKRR